VVEVAIDGGPADAELGGDLRDGELVVALFVDWSYICRASSACLGRSLSFGPPTRPRARAAASPSRVRSDIKECSIIWTGRFPQGLSPGRCVTEGQPGGFADRSLCDGWSSWSFRFVEVSEQLLDTVLCRGVAFDLSLPAPARAVRNALSSSGGRANFRKLCR